MNGGLRSLLLVAVGGALGAAARWWVAGLVQFRTGAGFPWGTFVVNVVGCFLIGLVMETAVATFSFGPVLRLFLVVGVLGGFTTWSSFSYETMKMLEEGAVAMAAANALGTMAACFAGTFAGLAAGRALLAAL